MSLLKLQQETPTDINEDRCENINGSVGDSQMWHNFVRVCFVFLASNSVRADSCVYIMSFVSQFCLLEVNHCVSGRLEMHV